MQAYAILDGGGVKGAALVGCLAAADDLGIQFVGYGGTSAGSIVALLSSIGYSPADLKRLMVKEMDFSKFLDDGGSELHRLRSIPSSFRRGRFRGLLSVARNARLIRRLKNELGLYRGDRLDQFLMECIEEKLGVTERDFRFSDLKKHGCRPLKVLASDISCRKSRIYSASGLDHEEDVPVLEAVRASMSYPFVFKPVPVAGRYLVDGGLSSNLPIFLFEEERAQCGRPVVAFDLVGEDDNARSEYAVDSYIGDMLATALESSDQLIRRRVRRAYYVPIPIPSSIRTLDFEVTREQREDLFTRGSERTHNFFCRKMPHWAQAKDEVDYLQLVFGSVEKIKPVLRAFALELEHLTNAERVRTHVMLPTARGTRVVAYHYNMDGDPDSDLDLATDGGCSGRAWSEREAVLADLERAKTIFADWGMTTEQQAKVRPDVKSMLSVPIFYPPERSDVRNVDDLDLVGVLSADSVSPLEETGWIAEHADERGPDRITLDTAKIWASVLGHLLN